MKKLVLRTEHFEVMSSALWRKSFFDRGGFLRDSFAVSGLLLRADM